MSTQAPAGSASWIEDMAQTQLKYELLLHHQSQGCLTDPGAFYAAMTRLQELGVVAQQGQLWALPQDPEAYMASCKEICEMEPCSLEDRIKIVHAAYGFLLCMLQFKIWPQPERVRLAVVRRHTELYRALYPVPDMPPLPNLPLPAQLQQPGPVHIPPREDHKLISPEEVSLLLQHPENLYGKKFHLAPNTEDSGVYEVVGYSRGRHGALRYEVLFEDCGEDALEVDDGEMQRMLGDSVAL